MIDGYSGPILSWHALVFITPSYGSMHKQNTNVMNSVVELLPAWLILE